MRSFQMKLALQATLVSGVVLTLFGLGLWHFIADSHQGRLDRDLAGLAHQLLVAGDHSLADLDLSAEQVAIYGEELESAATMLTDLHQHTVHRSANWPDAVTAQTLPKATQADRTRLPDHVHRNDDGHVDRHHHATIDAHARETLIEPQFTTVRHDDRQWRLVGLSNTHSTLHVALDLATFNANLAQVRGVMLLAVGAALAASALGGWWVARRALRPVRTLTEMAENVTATALDQRIADQSADLEFERLIRVFNDMLERLDTSFQQAVRFSADASHELRTPLTIMRGEVETALQRATIGSDVQRTLASQLVEIQRLDHLVGKLLLLSRADSGSLRPDRRRFDFGNLVRRVGEDIPALDSDLDVDAKLDVTVELDGDHDLLRQAVQNLVVNAVRYNRPGGWIRYELEQAEDRCVLRISNSGAPIPTSDRERIFQRFYRVDRSRTGDHVGLGLSLAREIVRIHGGGLELLHSNEAGTAFELTLPLISGRIT